MSEFGRRKLLIAGGVGASSAFAGCGNRAWKSQPDYSITVGIEKLPERSDSEGSYELTVALQLAVSHGASIRDVVLHIYAKDGNVLVRHPIGTLNVHESVEVTPVASRFPAIITASAARSVCNDLTIQIVYVNGPITPAEDRKWDYTVRECGEELPPKRLLAGNESTSPGN